MKKILKGISLVLAATSVVSLASCFGGGGATGNSGTQAINKDMTQLYIHNYGGGFGSDWLKAAAKRFEDLHKDDVLEEGKKGIQIVIDSNKKTFAQLKTTMLDDRSEIYFQESASYTQLINEGLVLDISDAVTDNLSAYGDSRSIYDKMNPEQRAYYAIDKNGETHYYAIPHYTGFFGIQYNIDLFNQYGYYFAQTPVGTTLEGKFISKANPKKSVGLDKVEGTSDDGLPTTYDEFFSLCDFIADSGNVPVSWAGETYLVYLQLMETALWADAEGLEQTMLTFKLDGQANTLSTIQNGQLVKDAQPTQITADNGYELARQAGRYYALKFMDKLMKTDKYHNELCYNGGYTFTSVQEDFLFGGVDGVTKPVAMMLEGSWWQSEASYTFEQMGQVYGNDYLAKNRNFGIMPFPKPTAEMAAQNTGNTMLAAVDSIAYIKSNIADFKKDLAIEFLRFVNTDESLREFTTITNTKKMLDYSMGDDINNLTPYGRNLLTLTAASDIVFPMTQTPVYINNSSELGSIAWFSTKYDSVGKRDCIPVLKETTVSVDTIFTGLYTYKESIWNSIKR